MDPQENGSTNNVDAGKIGPSISGKPEKPVVDYAATGARPKIFPTPYMPRGGAYLPKRQMPPRPFRETSHEQSDEDEELQHAFGSMTIEKFRPAAGDHVLFYGLPSRSAANDYGDDDCMEADYSGERSAVEITMADAATTPEDLDAAFAKSLEWEEKNQFGGPGYEPGDEDEEFKLQHGYGKGVPGFGFNAIAQSPALVEGGEGIDDLAEEFPAGGGRHHLDENQMQCPYCDRPYSKDFLKSHLDQCVHNPVVNESREDARRAIEASVIDLWRSTPNPPPGPGAINALADEDEDLRRAIEASKLDQPRNFGSAVTPEDSVLNPAVENPGEFQVGRWSEMVAAQATGGYDPAIHGGACYDSDDPMIPCELCGALLPIDRIMDHQAICGHAWS